MKRLYKVKKDDNKPVPLSDTEAVAVYEHLDSLESEGENYSEWLRKSIKETSTETVFDYDIVPKKIQKIVDNTLRLILRQMSLTD